MEHYVITKQGTIFKTDQDYMSVLESQQRAIGNTGDSFLIYGENNKGHKVMVPMKNVAYFEERPKSET